jgi:hypothetical protein
VPGGGPGVLQSPERVPACVKFGFGDVFWALCEMGCRKLVGSPGVAFFVKPTADHAGFHPPLVGIDQESGIPGHLCQKGCGLLVAIEFAQLAYA